MNEIVSFWMMLISIMTLNFINLFSKIQKMGTFLKSINALQFVFDFIRNIVLWEHIKVKIFFIFLLKNQLMIIDLNFRVALKWILFELKLLMPSEVYLVCLTFLFSFKYQNVMLHLYCNQSVCQKLDSLYKCALFIRIFDYPWIIVLSSIEHNK